MRNDGNVMIAVDTAGRMLELAQLLVRTTCVAQFELTFAPPKTKIKMFLNTVLVIENSADIYEFWFNLVYRAT